MGRLFFVLLTVAFCAPLVHADDYKIKVVRPDKVGDQYSSSITAKFSVTTVNTKNGEETDRKTDAFNASCQGTVKVMAIDEAGVACKIRFEVESLTKGNRKLYPQGTVIIAKRENGETSFEIEGERPDDENAAVLNTLLEDVGRNHGLSNDAEGKAATAPQAVGSTWPLITGKIDDKFGGEDSPITPDLLKAEGQLVSVKNVDGKDVMVVESKITADGFKKDLEGRGSIRDGKLSVVVTDVLPVDETQPKLSSTTKITMSMTICPPLGSAKSIVTTKLDRRERRDPVEDQ
jgi:hypothetical protein